jgi:hypothetical protein
MKIKNTLKSLMAIAIIATLFTSCAKDGATGPAGNNGANGAVGPTGPTGPIATGNLTGFVKKFDQYGNIYATGLSGVNVSTTGGATLSTTTDSTGKYAFSNISTGYYTINVTDTLFGPVQVNNFQFLGGATVERGNTNISAIPNFVVTSLTFVDTVINGTDSAIEINGTLGTTDAYVRSVIIYVGSTISTSSAPANFQTYVNVNSKAGTNTFKTIIALNTLYDLGYIPTQTVYFAAYGIAADLTSSVYQDVVTGRNIFTAISPIASQASHMIQ